MSPFLRRNGELSCEGVPLTAVAREVGTPVYVYSQAELLRRAHTFLKSVPPSTLVCYAVKANGNPALIRLLGQAGFGADVTSGGELFLARQAGITAERIVFSGVGKTADEVALALEAGIRAIHIESEHEQLMVASVAAEMERVAPIGVRINPNIGAGTHPYISTGLQEHKFGLPPERALEMLKQASLERWLEPVALASHIGSQISDIAPFAEAAAFLAAAAEEAASAGIRVAYLDVGGGLGIDYAEGESDQQAPEREEKRAETGAPAKVPTIEQWVTAVSAPVAAAGFQLVIEPGRSLVGPAGALLTRVIHAKEQGGKRFLITDAGMSDLMRPALYDAYHPILPVKLPAAGSPLSAVEIVGPLCESSDRLAKGRLLPPVEPEALLAILHAGAYGFAMSSNYNGRLRPAEVLVNGDQFHLIRRRQNYEHLLDGC